MNSPTPSSDSAKPPAKSRLRRWSVRLLRVAVALYLACCVILYFAQNFLIFPGAYVHNRERSQVGPAPGREVLELHTPGGQRVAAIFGAALTEDGMPLTDASTRPTILYFYGNGDCIRTSLQQFTKFRRLGYNVMIPEYIGYPMSGGRPSEAGLYATANAAYAELLTRHDVDPHRIVVVGRSLGGAAAIDLASREPVAGLATFSAFTSMDAMARKVMPIIPTGLFLKSHFNNLQKIGHVQCPVFLAHGTKDSLVPFSSMGRLAAQVKGPVTTFAVDGANHNDIFNVDPGLLLQKFAEFIDSLPGKSGLK
jgi:fermentation-respiration switch protein FrsA (DUF1100 family)